MAVNIHIVEIELIETIVVCFRVSADLVENGGHRVAIVRVLGRGDYHGRAITARRRCQYPEKSTLGGSPNAIRAILATCSPFDSRRWSCRQAVSFAYRSR